MVDKIYTLTDTESHILTTLVKKNQYEQYNSTILLILATRSYARPKKDLIGILQEFPGLDDSASIEKALDYLVQEEYVRIKIEQDICIYQMDEQGFNKYCLSFDDALKKSIRACRNIIKDSSCVEIYGLLTGASTGGTAYTTFIQRIKNAQTEILMPMLNTEPHEATIKVLEEAAERGVFIYLLFADYQKVVSKLRNKNKNQSTFKEWQSYFKKYKDNVHIRIYTQAEDTILSSSVIIDNKITRLCIHDNLRERTTMGTLIEVSKQGYSLNITTIVRDRFFDIWNRSYKPGQHTLSRVFLSTDTWLFIFAGIMFLICFFFDNIITSILEKLIVAIITCLITKHYKSILYKINRVIRAVKTG